MALLTLCLAVVAAGSGYYYHEHQQEYSNAMEVVLSWARLAAFPSAAHEVRLSVEGGFFTRAFRVSFTAPGDEITKWLEASPGFGDAIKTQPAIGIDKFIIRPGGGAMYAEVIVDWHTGKVSIYTYWS